MQKKVLVADDEKSITSSLAYALTREGSLVETALDGEEAVLKVSSSWRRGCHAYIYRRFR